MQALQPNRKKEIFDQARKLSPAQRVLFLDSACGSDAQLRCEVAQLLDDLDAAGELLADPTVGGDSLHPAELSLLGSSVGCYELLQRIGEGGFGTVFLAEQREPVRRQVALKVIKPGMDSKQVIARFEAERQALAMMDHPSIAHVLDAGQTDPQSPLGAGRPYFVMELVRGVPITQYCNEQQVPLRERLALFADVCQAVQHAHQKGIIHRDLKPSNVLVTRSDDGAASVSGPPGDQGASASGPRGNWGASASGRCGDRGASAFGRCGLVKIIDFGIAKAMTGRLTDKTLFTEARQLIGTPAYMSPEQAGLSDLDVDTRSDIYSLGVLLYELLTGTTPFDAERLRSVDYDELRRIIREEEPPKPSTRLEQATKARGGGTSVPPASAAASPANDPATLDDSSAEFPRVSAPKPGRRVDGRLASGVRGELDWIVMKCLEKDRSRRYETANGVALEIERYLRNEPVLAGPRSRVYRLRRFVRRNRAIVTAGTLLAVALLAGIAGTTYGLLRAEQRRVDAEAAQDREREQRELAEQREKQTEQVADFQAAMLSGIDAEEMGRAIKQRFRDQVRAALERQDVGEFPDRRARTLEEIEADLAAFDQLANAAQESDVARQVLEEVLLAPAARTLETQFADQPLVRARLHHAMAEAYHDSLGLNDAAEFHARRALDIAQNELGENHELVAASLHLLGHLRFHGNDYAGARPLVTEALAIYRSIYGDGSSQVARALDELGAVLSGEDAGPEAEGLYRRALAAARQQLGNGHPDVAPHLSNLARLLSRRGDDVQAEALYAEALAIERTAHSPVRPSGAACMSDLAGLLLNRGDYAGAEALYTEALDILRGAYGDEHRQVAITLNNLGYLSWKRGDHARVERVFHVNPANGHRYCTTSFRCWGASDATPGRTRPDWWDAEAEARALGGHLATIDDAAEGDWVFTTFGPESFWIGLTDWDSEGTFHWINGAPVAYTNWDAIAGVVFQPDNAHAGGEDTVHANGDRAGRWNDLGERGNSPGHSSHPLYGIIELDPPARADPGS